MSSAVPGVVLNTAMVPLNVAGIAAQQFTDSLRTIGNQISAKFQLLSGTPEIIPVILIALLVSTLWFPFHPLIFEVAQGCWSCTGRQTVALIADVMDVAEPPITRVMQYANIVSRAPGVILVWTGTLFLKCDGTVRALDRVRRGAVFMAEAASVEIALVAAAVFARDTHTTFSGTAAALACDAVREWFYAVSDVGNCYCAVNVMWSYTAAVIVGSNNAKCAVKNANIMGLEVVSQTTKTIVRVVEYGVDVLTWFFYIQTRDIAKQRTLMYNRATALAALYKQVRQPMLLPPRVLARISGPFPMPNLTYILPSVDTWADTLTTMSCCVGDLTNDIANGGVLVALQAVLSVNATGPIAGNFNTGQLLRDWRPGNVVKSAGPVVAETVRYWYNLGRSVLTSKNAEEFVDAFKANHIDRMLDTYEAWCISNGDAFFGVLPASMMGASGLANNTLFQHLIINAELTGLTLGEAYALIYATIAVPMLPGLPMMMTTPMGYANAAAAVTALYGGAGLPFALFPNATQSGCRALVSFARALVHITTDAPTHSEFVDRKYFDCTLHHMHNAATALGTEVNKVFDMAPAFDSCRILYDEGSIVPRVSCSRPLLLGSLGDLSRGTTDLGVTLLNYGLTLVENAGDADAVLHTPTDPIFDNITYINGAIGRGIQGIISSIAPMHVLTWTLPDTNVTVHVDRMFGENLIGLFTERSMNTVVEIGRLLARTIQHGLNVSYIQDFARTQSLLVNTTAEMLGSIGCTIKNAMDDANYTGDRCLYRMSNGVCPLDIVLWCDKQEYFAAVDTYNQLLLTMVEMVAYPKETLERKLFADVLGSLKNVAARIPFFVPLNDINVDWSESWGTNETLDTSRAISELFFAWLSILSAGNTGAMELLHAINRGTDVHTDTGHVKHALCSDPEMPVYDPIEHVCKPCQDVVVNASDVGINKQQLSRNTTYDACSVYVETGSVCCPLSGRCFDGPCYNPGLVRVELELALGNLNQGFEDLFRTLGIFDKRLQMMFTRLSKSGLNVANGVVKAIFVSPDHIKYATYVFDDFGWAVGNGLGIPLAVAGHVIMLIGTLPDISEDDKASIRTINGGINNLTGSIAAVANSMMTVFGDTVAYVLDGASAVLEGDTDADRYVNTTQIAMKAVEDDLKYIQVTIREAVANLAITNSTKLLNASKFVEMSVEVGTSGLIQFVRSWAMLVTYTNGKPTDLLPPVTIANIFQSMRRWSLSLGVVATDVVYQAATGVLTAESLDSNSGTFTAIGNVVTTTLNWYVSAVESVYQIMFLFLNRVIPSFISETYATSAPITTISNATAIWLQSTGGVGDIIIPGISTYLNQLATFISATFGNPTSGLVSGLTSIFNLFIAGFRLSVAWITNDTSAVSTFVTAIREFLTFSVDQILDQSAALLDSMIWPTITVNGWGPFQCVLDLGECVWDFVENWGSQIFDLISSFITRSGEFDPVLVFQVAAILTPVNDSCHGIFLDVAKRFTEGNITFNNTSLWYSFRLQLCMSHFSSNPAVIEFLGQNTTDVVVDVPPPSVVKRIAHLRSTTHTNRAHKRTSENLVEYAGCLERADPGVDCAIDSISRTSTGLSILWEALKRGFADGSAAASDGYLIALLDEGVAPDKAAAQATAFAQSFDDMHEKLGDVSAMMFDGDPDGITTHSTEVVSSVKQLAAILDGIASATMAPRSSARSSNMERLRKMKTSSVSDAAKREIVARATGYYSTLPGWNGANTSLFTRYYAIASYIDLITTNGCNDGNQYNDDYGCNGTEFTDISFDEPVQPPSLDVYPWSNIGAFIMENPCPRLSRCPGYRFARGDLLDKLCEVTCNGPSTTPLFKAVCMTTPTRYTTTGQAMEDTWIMRPDGGTGALGVVMLDVSDVISVLGSTGDATCAEFGSGNLSYAYGFCRDRCNANVPLSYAANASATGSVPLKEFLSMLCTAWCEPARGSCPTSTDPIDCTTGPTGQTACLARCPYTWQHSGIPTPLDECAPNPGMNCEYRDPTIVYPRDSSCMCLPNQTVTTSYSRCWYAFGSNANTTVPSNVTSVSFCPTLSHPVFSFFDGIDYTAMSQQTRVKITYPVTAIPTITRVAGNLPVGTTASVYTPPSQQFDMLCASSSPQSKNLTVAASYGTVAACFVPELPWTFDNVTNQYIRRVPSGCGITGTYMRLVYGPDDITSNVTLSVSATICATWSLTTRVMDCAAIPTFDSGVNGVCDQSVCTSMSNFYNPVSISPSGVQCGSEAHCATGKFEPISCTLASAEEMTTRLCGVEPLVQRYTRPSVIESSATTPIVYVRASGTLVGDTLVSPTRVSFWSGSMTVAVSCRATRWIDDPVMSNPHITPIDFIKSYGVSTSPVYDDLTPSTQLDTMAKSQQLVFTNVPSVGTRTSPLPRVHSVVYASSTDFCSALCQGEQYCNTVFTHGFNCNYYRDRYAAHMDVTHGAAYARTWLCMAFPDTPMLTNENFPLTTTSVRASQVVPHVLYSIYTTNSCAGPGPCTLVAPGPQTPEGREVGPLSAAQCEKVRQYADNVLPRLLAVGINMVDYRNSLSARGPQEVHHVARTTAATKVLRTYSLPHSFPVPYTDWMDTPMLPHEDLAVRRCTYEPQMPCDTPRCDELRAIAVNSSIAFLDWQMSDERKFYRAADFEDLPSMASEQLLDNLAGFDELMQYVFGSISDAKYTARDFDSVAKVKAAMLAIDRELRAGIPGDFNASTPKAHQGAGLEPAAPSILSAMIRTIKMTSCHMDPNSPACDDLKKAAELHGYDINEFKRRREVPAREDQDFGFLDITRSVALSYRDSIIPELQSQPHHCYIVFTANWTDILTDLYVWKLIDRYGPVGHLWDVFMMDRAITGYMLSPESDGSELYLGGGPIATFDISKLSGPVGDVNAVTRWFSDSAILSGFNGAIADIIGKMLGVRPTSTNPSDIALAIMASAQGRNSTDITEEEFSTWVRNTNMDSEAGSVGLTYYVTAVLPIMPDWAKVSGELRILGFPLWTPACGIPFWLPRFIANITRFLSEQALIVPGTMLEDSINCTADLPMSIPFTVQCPAEPHAKSCFTYALSTPLHVFFAVANMVAPSIMEWSVTRSFLASVGLDSYNAVTIGTLINGDFWTGIVCIVSMALASIPWLLVIGDILWSIAFGTGIVFLTAGVKLIVSLAEIVATMFAVQIELVFKVGLHSAHGAGTDEEDEGIFDPHILFNEPVDGDTHDD